MKKTILATLVLVISAFATVTAGGKSDADRSSSKKITMNTTGFTKLVVDGNVDVVLFEDDSASDIRTFGDAGDMASLTITEKNGVLSIKNKKSFGQKVLVYVPVKSLSVIEASGDSKVSSATALSSNITLIAKGDCKFNIVSAGAIEIEQENEVEVNVEKRTIYTTKTTTHS